MHSSVRSPREVFCVETLVREYLRYERWARRSGGLQIPLADWARVMGRRLDIEPAWVVAAYHDR